MIVLYLSFQNVENDLQTKETEAPRLALVFLNDDESKLDTGFVIGDKVTIPCNSSSIYECLLILLSVYYIYRLNYPETYGQFMGFLQQVVLKHPYTGKKGSNFVQTLKLLS